MKKTPLLIVSLAALAVSAVAFASDPPSPNQLAVQSCKQQVAALGGRTFRSTYGPNAFGKCVSRATSAAREDLQNAAKQCVAERKDPDFATSHDGKTFADYYGANGNHANAFGKCVSAKAKAATHEDAKAVATAAKQCKSEWRADKTQFRTDYGYGPRKVAAFARCVKAKLSSTP
jgi:hypothetical protein